jgi:uncharacterized membrane protein YgdD (TMEM256/DUF423 family)
MGGAAHVLIALAGLAGASGVALAAVAAHKVESASLTTAALLLVLHGVAAVALVAVAPGSPLGRWMLAGAWILLFGAFLFTGTVAKLTLQGTPLFPMSAPTGGTLMIAGWLVVAVVALLALAQR